MRIGKDEKQNLVVFGWQVLESVTKKKVTILMCFCNSGESWR